MKNTGMVWYENEKMKHYQRAEIIGVVLVIFAFLTAYALWLLSH